MGGEGGESGGVDEGKGGEREEGKDEVKEKRGKIWRSFNAAIYPPNPVSKYLNCEKHMTYDMRYSFKVLQIKKVNNKDGKINTDTFPSHQKTIFQVDTSTAEI